MNLARPILPVWICALLNMAIFVGVCVLNPGYMRAYRPSLNPDAAIYVDVGRNVFLHGAFSRDLAPPYSPDFGLTPTYPLFAGGLELLLGVSGLFAVQMLLGVATCGLIYRLAATFCAPRTAWWAAMLYALDPLLAAYHLQPMSETLYLFLLVAGLVVVLPLVRRETWNRRAWLRLALGALLLGISILARPAGLYVPVILAPFLAASRWKQRASVGQRAGTGRRTVAALLAGAVLLGASYIPVWGWIFRNWQTFGTPTLSRTQSIMLVYYTGASAWQVHFGVTQAEAQEMIRQKYGLPSHLEVHNPSVAARSPEEMEAALHRHTRDVLLEYPGDLAVGMVRGVGKGLVAHDVNELAAIFGQTWTAPGSENLLRDPGTFCRRLAQNPAPWQALFLWSLVFNPLLVLGAGWGAVRILTRRDTRDFGLILLLLGGYVLLTMGLAGVECICRYRIPLVFILHIFAGGACSLYPPARRGFFPEPRT